MTATATARTQPTDYGVTLASAGLTWDAVRVRGPIGAHVLDLLGAASGAVVHDNASDQRYWFVPPSSADGWYLCEAVVLSVATYVALPPVGCHEGLLRWAVPAERGMVTDANLLLAALPLADAIESGPRIPEGLPLPGVDMRGLVLPCAPCQHGERFVVEHVCVGSSRVRLGTDGRMRPTLRTTCPCPKCGAGPGSSDN
ncbi:hypothetical protein [Streptomyces sp. 8L]|uniref:hypothetical protein n=1 Tax=Streptomyces sp. 8L TaxID=2877242 RepID=UPI001CD6E842|nr:hypothetical protein [Streptomyces sp. 8L]MCA1220039.1 hypothetical protein [Streptomyces sp. 8L]